MCRHKDKERLGRRLFERLEKLVGRCIIHTLWLVDNDRAPAPFGGCNRETRQETIDLIHIDDWLTIARLQYFKPVLIGNVGRPLEEGAPLIEVSLRRGLVLCCFDHGIDEDDIGMSDGCDLLAGGARTTRVLVRRRLALDVLRPGPR